MSAKAKPARNGSSYFGRGDIVASSVVIFPLLICYQILVLFSARVNGADFVTRLVFALCRDSKWAYIGIHVGLSLLFMLWIRQRGRAHTMRISVLGPLIVESAVYGLCLGGILSLVVHRGLGLSLSGQEVVAALGAGVHEEIVFRFVLIAATLWLLRRCGVNGHVALLLAFFASALVFALAHHIGADGEPFAIATMVYRCLAGIAFALIYWYRSLAHAVYAHVIYDLAVFGLR